MVLRKPAVKRTIRIKTKKPPPKEIAPNNGVKYEKLALMKKEVKELELKIKKLQTQIIEKGAREEVETSVGILKYYEQKLYKPTNMEGVLDAMGSTLFLKSCSISKTRIVEGIGSRGFYELVDDGIMKVSSISKFYKLSKKK